MTVTIKNVEQVSPRDFPPGVHAKLLSAQRQGLQFEYVGVACQVDGQFEHDYHDIKRDGRTFEAVSGLHLEVWK